jgi:hypothetical protein
METFTVVSNMISLLPVFYSDITKALKHKCGSIVRVYVEAQMYTPRMTT